jgi:hypothetical protein
MAGACSTADPYLFNEYPPQGIPGGVGYNNILGRALQSSVIADRANTAVIIVDGQSEHATAGGTATYTTVNAQAHQLSIYDGGIYSGADPVLGCSYAPSVGPSSMTMRIADRIITRGKATRVVMVPIAMGGTPWAIYDPAAAGSLFTRFQAAYRRLASIGLAPDKIIVGRGATDNTLATSAASVRASINAWVAGVRGLGCSAPIYIGKFTMVGGATSANVQTGIANAISDNSGNNVSAGYDGDTNLTVAGGFRLADGTHPSNTGLTTGANGWADLIYP